MSESTPAPAVAVAPPPSPELGVQLNPLADRLMGLHVDKAVFAICGILSLILLLAYTWLYFNPTW